MSDAPTPPARAELDANSLPAIVRRAPGFVRTIVIGVAGGAVLGVAIGLGLPGAGDQYRALVTVLVAAGFALIGGLVAGATATRETMRHTKIDDWQERIDARLGSRGSGTARHARDAGSTTAADSPEKKVR